MPRLLLEKFSNSSCRYSYRINSVRDRKPEEASRIANTLREVAAEKIIAVTRVSDVTTLEEARPAQSPSSPNIRRNTILGFGAGAGLVIVVVLIIELLDDRVKRSRRY